MRTSPLPAPLRPTAPASEGERTDFHRPVKKKSKRTWLALAALLGLAVMLVLAQQSEMAAVTARVRQLLQRELRPSALDHGGSGQGEHQAVPVVQGR